MKVGIISLYGIENSGVRYLSSMLKQSNHEVYLILFKKWINNNVCPPTDEEIRILISLLSHLKVGLVGIGFGSPYFKVAKKISLKVKQELNVPIVWGGIHPTLVPNQCINIADVVCIGEGEGPILDLANALSNNEPIHNINNLWIRQNGRVKKNPVRPLISNLDDLPTRDFGGHDKFFIENNRMFHKDPILSNREHRVSATRGCPYSCSYCYNSTVRKIYNRDKCYYRVMSVDGIMKELKNAVNKFNCIRRIKFDDDTFYFFNPDWIDEFCDRYRKEINIPFEILLNPSLAKKEMLSKLRRAGLDKVQIGIQGGSEEDVETVYNRPARNDKLIQLGYDLKQLHVEVVYDIIFDNPLSNEKDKLELLNLLLQLPRPYKLYLYSLTYFPNTKITKEFLQQGIITPKDVEGEATKSFKQFRLNLNAKRPKSERFWVCIVSLSSKSFIPKPLIKFLSRTEFIRKFPIFVQILANIANFIKMIYIFIEMTVIKREMTITKFKEYANIKKLLIQ